MVERAAARWPGRAHEGPPVFFEALEARLLLSQAPVATPDFRLYYPAGSTHPADYSSATGLTPTQILHAYGFDVTKFGTTAADGTGQTIAIVDAYNDPNIVSDVQVFDTQFSLPACNLIRINQTGGTTLPGNVTADPNGSWALETTLDVEWAHAVAPKATIVLVEANSDSTSDLYTAVGTAAAYSDVSVVSMSWGANETSNEVTSYDHYFTTPANHNGVTFLAATGDDGAYISRHSLGVDYPAASPNVLAVGGTTLTLNSNGNYSSETGWGNGTNSYRAGGSGGGISRYENQPAYQTGVVTQSTTKRTTPDVALDADPDSGVAVYDSWDYPSLPWFQVGGTSLATPLWAGIIAMVNQGRSLIGLSSLDGPSQTLPKIYALPATDFHDITSGNNGYAAGPGYDLVTGRGTPIVNLLVPDLVGSASNNPPTLSETETAALAYTEGQSATDITATLVAADVESANLVSATVQITANYQNGQDVLAFTNTPNITGTWNATTGTLTLTGSDTVADYQAALRAVTYENTSLNPSVLTRTVSFMVNDGAANSNTVTRSIAVLVPPALSGIETSALAYTEGQSATDITATLVAADAESANLVSATVQISGNYASGQDVLAFANTPNITGTWNATTATLTLAGSDTVADYQAALRAVTYLNTSQNPSALTRTVSFMVNDGMLASNTVTRSITVTPVNNPPTLSGIEVSALAYTEGQSATDITATLVAADAESANLVSATVQISGNYASGQDVLAFANTPNITGTWNATTATLTLAGSDTVADYQAALRAVTYLNTSQNPSALTRTVSFMVNDGMLASNTVTRSITVTPVNNPPTLSGIEVSALAYTEGQSATDITATLVAADVDNTNLASATVQITGNYQNGQDVLAFVSTASITGAWNATTATLTLAGSDTVADYQAALRAVTYLNTSQNPSALTRTVSFMVNDGMLASNTVTRSITVTPVNNPPTLSGIETTALAYTENDPATDITATLVAADVDNTNLASATVQITGNYQNGQDVLAFVSTANITGTWDAVAGTLTLAGSDTVADYQAALRAVTYQNSSQNPSALTRTVSFMVNDGMLASNTVTRNITVTPVNNPPTLSGIEVSALAYTESDPATDITATLVAGDVDSPDLASATVQITGNYQNGQDVLAFVSTANITGTWDAAAGTLTLAGSDTVADYQTALRAVTYQNTSQNPSALTRTVSFTVSDGQANSNTVTRDITVTPVNNPPTLSGIEASALAYTENDPATDITATLVAGDVDSPDLASATVQITGNYQNGQDVLAFVSTANITGTWDAAAGTLTLAGTDTVADYQAALRAVTYQNTAESPSPLIRTISFTVSDGALASNTVTRTVTVTDTTTHWTGAADTHWENAANWSNGVVPGPAVTAVLDGTPTLNQPVLYQNEPVLGVDILTAGWTIDLNGCTLSVGAGGLNMLLSGGLPTSTVNVTTGVLIVNRNDTSLATIQAWIRAGEGTISGGLPLWNGTDGLTSSAAKTNIYTSLGVRDMSVALATEATPPTSFGGLPVDSNSIVVKYTWYGDLNLDGQVTYDDYSLFIHDYQNPGGLTMEWATGDLNGDGQITYDDYSLLIAGYSHQSGTLSVGEAPATAPAATAPTATVAAATAPVETAAVTAAQPVPTVAVAPAPAAAPVSPLEPEPIAEQLRKSGGDPAPAAAAMAPVATSASRPADDLSIWAPADKAGEAQAPLAVTAAPPKAAVLRI